MIVIAIERMDACSTQKLQNERCETRGLDNIELLSPDISHTGATPSKTFSMISGRFSGSLSAERN